MTSTTNSTSLLSAFNQLGLATTASGSAAGSNSTAGATGTTQSLSQSDFLKLLTTQLTHQDPTNPTDSNAFLTQMAQFSTVSGIQNLLTSFQTLSSSISSNQALQASSLVGQTVSAPGTQGLLSAGGSISGDFTLTSAASDAKVTITDSANGALVNQLDLGSQAAGDVPFTWNGTDSTGAAVNPGVYNVQVTALIGGTNTAVTSNIQSKVASVSLGSGSSGLQVNLQGLGSVPFSKVTTIE